jgi:hypothetical protein
MKEAENTRKGFDYRVQVKDPKTGKVIKYQPYAMVIENGITKLERPIKSGIWYHPNGELIEKETKKADKKEKVDESKTDITP